MTDLANLKARVLANPEVREEYEIQTPAFGIARELIAARTRAGLTQAEVAERMRTKQSTIARLESGGTMPPMRILACYAEATGSRVEALAGKSIAREVHPMRSEGA